MSLCSAWVFSMSLSFSMSVQHEWVFQMCAQQISMFKISHFVVRLLHALCLCVCVSLDVPGLSANSGVPLDSGRPVYFLSIWISAWGRVFIFSMQQAMTSCEQFVWEFELEPNKIEQLLHAVPIMYIIMHAGSCGCDLIFYIHTGVSGNHKNRHRKTQSLIWLSAV